MKVELPPEDAVRFAVNSAKTRTLRDELEAAEREGGSFITEDVRRFARERLDTRGVLSPLTHL
jgi:hypothetical protein